MLLGRFRLALAVGMCVIAAGAWPAAAAADPASSSSGWQVDAEHSGYLYGAGVAPPLTAVWADHFDAWSTSLSLGDDQVYAFVDTPQAGDQYAQYLEAINLANGAVDWTQTFGGDVLGGPYYTTVADGEVLAAYDWRDPQSAIGYLQVSAFNESTGQELWTTRVPDQSDPTPPIVHDGVLYMEGDGVGGNVYAINVATGAPVWESAQLVSGFPVVWAGNALVMGTECPFAIGFNPADGSVLWPSNDDCDSGGSPMASSDGTHVWVDESFVTDTGYIYDPSTGAQTGTFTGNAPAFGYGEAVQNEGNYGGSENTTIRAFDPNTMNTLWTFTEPAYQYPGNGDYYQGSQPLLADGSVFAEGPAGQVWALSPCTGAVQWQSQVDPAPGGPEPLDSLVAGDGYLVVPSAGGLTGFKGSGTPATVPDCQSSTSAGSGTGGGTGSGSGTGSGAGSGTGGVPGPASAAPQPSVSPSFTPEGVAATPVAPAAATQPVQQRAVVALRLLAARCVLDGTHSRGTTCTVRLRAAVPGRLTMRLMRRVRTLTTRVLQLRRPRQLRLTAEMSGPNRPATVKLVVSLRPGARQAGLGPPAEGSTELTAEVRSR